MNLKNFIIASLIIHIVGAIALYFYYNPITFAPKLVKVFEDEEVLSQKQTEEATQNLKTKTVPLTHERKKKNKKSLSVKSKSLNQNKIHANEQISKQKKRETSQKTAALFKKANSTQNNAQKQQNPSQPTKLDLKNAKTDSTLTQQEALSESKIPLTEIQAPSIETTDSPVELEFHEIEGNQNTKEIEFIDDSPSQEKEAEENQNIKEIQISTNSEEIKKIDKQNTLEEISKTKNKSDQTTQISEQTNSDSSSSEKQIKNFQDLQQKRGNTPLNYPDFARRAKMEGTVSVLFFVTQQGLVEQIQLESSSGHSELDNFVLRTLSRYEFFPRQETWVRYNIPFILEGEEIERLKLREEKKI